MLFMISDRDGGVPRSKWPLSIMLIADERAADGSGVYHGRHAECSVRIECADRACERPPAARVVACGAGPRSLRSTRRNSGALQSAGGSPRTPCDHPRLHCGCSGRLTDWNLRGRAGSASDRCIRREVNSECDRRSGNRGSSAGYPPHSRRAALESGS